MKHGMRFKTESLSLCRWEHVILDGLPGKDHESQKAAEVVSKISFHGLPPLSVLLIKSHCLKALKGVHLLILWHNTHLHMCWASFKAILGNMQPLGIGLKTPDTAFKIAMRVETKASKDELGQNTSESWLSVLFLRSALRQRHQPQSSVDNRIKDPPGNLASHCLTLQAIFRSTVWPSFHEQHSTCLKNSTFEHGQV